MLLAISTPGEPQGRFYEIHARRPGCEDWWVRHVTLLECLRAGRIGPEWAAQRKVQWGEQSAVYRNRVLGEFASSEEDGIIPLTWIEAANERWQALQESGQWGPFLRCGVDVARGGRGSDGDRPPPRRRHQGVAALLRAGHHGDHRPGSEHPFHPWRGGGGGCDRYRGRGGG